MIDPITSGDEIPDLRKGDVVTLKGKLTAAIYGHISVNLGRAHISLAFADWTGVTVYLDAAAAEAIRIPRGAQVSVKARVTNHDQNLEAIAIWEPGGVPIPLGCQVT